MTRKSEGKDEIKQERGATFEQSMQRLQEIVELLDGGELPLEKAISLYEEGMDLSKRCTGLLDQAEARVEVLMGNTGKVEKVDLDGQG